MNVKISLRDWHGVADAAMDIRELEAKIQVYKEVNSTRFSREYLCKTSDEYFQEVTNVNP